MPIKAPANKISKITGGLVTHELLIEIGTEEMPANYLAYANDPDNDLFRKKFREVFDDLNESKAFSGGDIKVYLTPRRIVLHVMGIAFDGSPKKEAVYGPAWQAAWGPDGRPTPPLDGFIKSKGIKVEDICEFENKGKKCAGYWKTEKPRPLSVMLPEFFPAFLKALTFPKTMWWDDTGLRFPRPIRTIICLLDDRSIRCKVGSLVTSDATRQFRQGLRTTVRVGTIKRYFAIMRLAGVILDQSDRRALIEKEVRALTTKAGGIYVEDRGLLDEVTYLTERPVCVAGRFDDSFQHLPKEALTVSLSKKQRLFSVFDSKGKHLPVFIMVLDGAATKKDLVADTASEILKAKLQDSHFFFEEDKKIYQKPTGVENLLTQLNNLVFLKDMGSMRDKVDRLQFVGKNMYKSWGLSDEEGLVLVESARLSKIDLLTQMVGEFPELQGIMGGYYIGFGQMAHEIAQKEQIAKVISEQYLPTSPDGRMPSNKVAAALSILDKADLITTCFAVGKIPTSSQDPYALKRSLAGIIRLASEYKLNISWEELADAFLSRLEQQGYIKATKNTIIPELQKFYKERISYYFQHRGFDNELVDAVVALDNNQVALIEFKISSLSKLINQESFQKTLKVIQRTSNILKSVDRKEFGPIAPDHFKEELERQLYDRYESRRSAIAEAIDLKDYGQATNLYADAFFDILHVFFEKVLVNAPESEVRRNRLSLLDSVRSLYTGRIADLSKIKQVVDSESALTSH